MKQFRRTTILILAAFLTIFAACSSDDDSEPDPDTPSGILGVWKITTLKFSAKTEDGIPMSGEIINLADINATINFKANGEYVGDTDGGYILKLTMDGMTFTRNVSPVFEIGNWEKDGSTLKIIDDSGTSIFQIESMSNTKIVLKANEVPGNDPEDEGFTDVDYTMILER